MTRRFKKLSHSLYECKYHIVFCPKYRYKILTGSVGEEVRRCIQTFATQTKTQVVELNVRPDHVHLLAMVPPKISISDYVGMMKGRTALRVFNKFRDLKEKPYWGNHFWSKGYCVDTVGLDEEMIRKYVKYQEKHELQQEELNFRK